MKTWDENAQYVSHRTRNVVCQRSWIPNIWIVVLLVRVKFVWWQTNWGASQYLRVILLWSTLSSIRTLRTPGSTWSGLSCARSWMTLTLESITRHAWVPKMSRPLVLGKCIKILIEVFQNLVSHSRFLVRYSQRCRAGLYFWLCSWSIYYRSSHRGGKSTVPSHMPCLLVCFTGGRPHLAPRIGNIWPQPQATGHTYRL